MQEVTLMPADSAKRNLNIPCEVCSKLINSEVCNPATCSYLEDLAIDLGEWK